MLGCGRVGVSAAFALVLSGFRNIGLYDIDKPRTEGEAMDLCDAAGERDAVVFWNEIERADIYVLTAGKPRSPGMTRKDLYGFNSGVAEPIFRRIAELNPDAHVIVVTNPSDEIAELGRKYLRNIVPSGEILDSSRAGIVFGRRMEITGMHSDRGVAGVRPGEEPLVAKFKERAADIIRLKGCTQWGVAAEILRTVERLAE
jgi:malate/lactate dehydrogenase